MERKILSNEELRSELKVLNNFGVRMAFIARLTGLSQQFLSAFLLGNKNMSEENREKVGAVVQELKGVINRA